MLVHGKTILLVMSKKAVKSSLMNMVQKQECFPTYSSSVVEKWNPSFFSCRFSPSRCAHFAAVYGTVDNPQYCHVKLDGCQFDAVVSAVNKLFFQYGGATQLFLVSQLASVFFSDKGFYFGTF